MATKLQAVGRYCPRVKLGKTVQLAELVEYIADRTGLNKGDIQMSLSELSSAVRFFNKRGEGVKLEGLGTYQPSVNLKGTFSVKHITDRDISGTLNASGGFSGEIVNRDNIGKSMDELVTLWNEEYPDDQITV